MVAANEIPVTYFPARPGETPAPVPFVLTDTDLIRFLRLDEAGIEKPELTLRKYRSKGWLKGTQVGPRLRYRLPDVLAFLENAQEMNPK